jgi:hypothetical protein
MGGLRNSGNNGVGSRTMSATAAGIADEKPETPAPCGSKSGEWDSGSEWPAGVRTAERRRFERMGSSAQGTIDGLALCETRNWERLLLRLRGPREGVLFDRLVVRVEGGFEEKDSGDAARHFLDVADFLFDERAAKERLFAVG